MTFKYFISSEPKLHTGSQHNTCQPNATTASSEKVSHIHVFLSISHEDRR